MPPAADTAVLYMMPGCGICLQVKQYLTRAAVPFEMRWLSEPEHLAWVQSWVAEDPARTQTAPFLVLAGQVVQGFDRARLDAVLRQSGFEPAAPEHGAQYLDPRLRTPEASWWVTDFTGGCIRFVIDDGEVTEPIPLGAGSTPIAVGFDPGGDVVLVSDLARDRVVLFDRASGRPVAGEVDASSLPVPRQPSDICVDPRRGLFYVVCVEGAAVVAIDGRTRDYAGGSLQAATMSTAAPTVGSLALDPDLDRLFVRRETDVVALDLGTRALVGGPSGPMTLPGGLGRNVAVDPVSHTVFVTVMDGDRHALAYLDGKDGGYVTGEAASSLVPTPAVPFGLAVDPRSRMVFVSCLGSATVCAFDADRPRARPEAEPIAVPPTTRSLSVDVGRSTVAASSFDAGSVTFIDSGTGRYRGGDMAAATVTVGGGLRGLAPVRPRA